MHRSSELDRAKAFAADQVTSLTNRIDILDAERKKLVEDRAEFARIAGIPVPKDMPDVLPMRTAK